MLTQSFRFVSLVFSALILGGAFCHVLEMPLKLAMAGADYMVVQQIYGAFGPVGMVLEPAAILSSVALAFLVRRRRSFVPALVGAVALVAALLVWATVVSPVNPHWAAAGPGTVPPDFAALRARWEWGHAAHAALLFLAFLALVVSVLVEVPRHAVAAEARRRDRRAA
jgi:hypothetical protein